MAAWQHCNAATLQHDSIARQDGLAALQLPVANEVNMVDASESFRTMSACQVGNTELSEEPSGLDSERCQEVNNRGGLVADNPPPLTIAYGHVGDCDQRGPRPRTSRKANPRCKRGWQGLDMGPRHHSPPSNLLTCFRRTWLPPTASLISPFPQSADQLIVLQPCLQVPI